MSMLTIFHLDDNLEIVVLFLESNVLHRAYPVSRQHHGVAFGEAVELVVYSHIMVFGFKEAVALEET